MMFLERKYSVSGTDTFNATNYPGVTNELNVLAQMISSLPDAHKADIVIAFLKDHKVKMRWVDCNPTLVELITSGYQPVTHTECLFESCKDNSTFQFAFEKYISNQLELVIPI